MSADELTLWQQVVKNVVPLHETGKSSPKELPEILPSKSTQKAVAKVSFGATLRPSAKKSSMHELMPDAMDRRSQQRLQRGLDRIDARLDLHGLTQDEAHHRLNSFIEKSKRSGKRTLLVITGRGERDQGVLKRMTPRWLSSPPIARHIRAFGHSGKIHGGAGALYVLLRRRG